MGRYCKVNRGPERVQVLEVNVPLIDIEVGEFNSIPSLELVHDQDNADALRRQLIMSPAIQEVTVELPLCR